MQSWCECWALITFRAQGSNSVPSMLATAFRERSACWVPFPTVSEVRQQDLGWVAGGPNDYSPDSGDSQWKFWPSRVKLAEFSTLHWAIPHHCSWFVDQPGHWGASLLHVSLTPGPAFPLPYHLITEALWRSTVLMPGANLSEHCIGMVLPGA